METHGRMIERGEPGGRLHIAESADVAWDAFGITASGHIYIGEHTIIASRVSLLCGFHDYTKRGHDRIYCATEGYDIRVGNGVWVCALAIIIGPCTIGDNAVIGAGSVVTKDVPANQVWAGNPARFIKEIVFK